MEVAKETNFGAKVA